VLNAHDATRIGSLFGGSTKNVLRIAKDGKLEAGQPLNRQVEPDGADRATATFGVLLSFRNGNNEDKQARAELRAITERAGTGWITKRCLIDSDGGAKY
jgi:hypothetical protein